jgi:uncharacterized protein (DUF1015 family)
MEERGLKILPTHRMLPEWPSGLDINSFLERVNECFEVQYFPFNGDNKPDVRSQFRTMLEKKGSEVNSIGFFFQNDSRYFLFSLKEGAIENQWLEGIPAELRKLDVVLLTRLLLQGILNMKDADLDNEYKVQYLSQFTPALDSVEQGRFAASFLLNSTPIDQVRKVAQASLIMPRKSTYFYPKVISGLVFNDLDPEGKIVLP